jgi:dissimilatory sulfite reductase (desulfoviridin) alpha/beta subunit
VGPATAGTACTPATEEDGFLIIRVRAPNELLTAEQVEAVGCISQRFGRDARDVTDRQNLQLHWIRIEDVSQICPVWWCEADFQIEPVKDDSSSSTSATTARQRPVWK